MFSRIVRQLARLGVEAFDVELGPEHFTEHRRIVAELVGKVAGRSAGLEDRELHAAAPCHRDRHRPMLNRWREQPARAPCADHWRRHRNRSRGRRASQRRRRETVTAWAADRAAEGRRRRRGRNGHPVRRYGSRAHPRRLRRSACGQRPDRLADRQRGYRRECSVSQNDPRSWDRIISTNLTAAFECSRAAIGDLLKSDNGRLVFVASVASLRGVPYAAHYAASKHGLLGLMRSLAAEYAKTNLTVNAVCPGYVDTPMTDQSVARVSQITGRSEDNSRSAITNMNASGRLVDPQAIGNVIAMLCLPLSRDINGAAITIDGGTSA